MARCRTWRWRGQGGIAQLGKPGVCGLQVGRAHVGSENMLTLGGAREGSWQALEMSGGNTFSRIERKGQRKKTLQTIINTKTAMALAIYRITWKL